MTTCTFQSSGRIELYFYGELDAVEHAQLHDHLPGCAECLRALEDLRTIRLALSARPDVSVPEGGDWAPFMARLAAAVHGEQVGRAPGASSFAASHGVGSGFSRTLQARTSSTAYLAMAALLALVTLSVVFAWRTRDRSSDVPHAASSAADSAPGTVTAPAARAQAHGTDSAFVALSEQHFERSKLVVLGLATKDPSDLAGADWEYERDLAGLLLNDTRLYRLTAEERGLDSLARIMQDLELLLLQASMSDKPDARALEQLQRVIRKRDLVTKIGVVTTTAGI